MSSASEMDCVHGVENKPHWIKRCVKYTWIDIRSTVTLDVKSVSWLTSVYTVAMTEIAISSHVQTVLSSTETTQISVINKG